MNRTSKPNKANNGSDGLTAKARPIQQSSSGTSGGFSYRLHVAASRSLFAAPPVDLTTLVIAQEIQRKARAERQREALRDEARRYDMPVRHERNEHNEHNSESSNERGGRNHRVDFDE
jgi:hypothetical protein